MGSLNSLARTADQTLYALFWSASTATYFWDCAVPQVFVAECPNFGRANIAMADAAIACWEAKYYYVFWRPVTAIPLADTDGNNATAADPTFEPLFAAPPHPAYPSGHSTVSGAATRVLARFFGERTSFDVTSDVMLGVTRSFRSFTDALHEVTNVLVFAGIPYRRACQDGERTGKAVADYMLANAVQRAEDDA